MSNITNLASPDAESKCENAKRQYCSIVVCSGGGVGFEDTSLTGLLAQTQDFVDHYPVGRGDYTAQDREDNTRVIWAIMADEPSSIDDDGTRYFVVGHCGPTIH